MPFEIHWNDLQVVWSSWRGHAEVVMHDFAASLLTELEKWMLTASPAMISLNTFADSSDKFLVPSTIAEEVSKRLYNDEVSHCSLWCFHTKLEFLLPFMQNVLNRCGEHVMPADSPTQKPNQESHQKTDLQLVKMLNVEMQLYRWDIGHHRASHNILGSVY